MRSLFFLSCLLSALCLGGCSTPPTTRAITGQLTAGAYPVSNAVVVAQSTDRRMFVAPVSASGSFRLTVPAGGTYRLVLASASGGVYRGFSRVTFPTASGRAHWAHVRAGSTVLLGNLRPAGTSATTGLQTASDDTGDDSAPAGSGKGSAEHEGDDEHDDAVECEAADATDSEADDVDIAGVNGDDGAAGEREAEDDMAHKCSTTPDGGGTVGGAGNPV